MIPSGWINSSSSLLGEREGGRRTRRREERGEEGRRTRRREERGEEERKTRRREERGEEGRRKKMDRRIRREQRGGGSYT